MRALGQGKQRSKYNLVHKDSGFCLISCCRKARGDNLRARERAIKEYNVAIRVRHLIPLQVLDRKSTRLNSSHSGESRMPSSA